MGIPGCGRWCGYRLGEPLFPANSPDTWDTLADFLGRAGGGVLVVLVIGGAGWALGSTGGGGGRGLPAMGLRLRLVVLGFRGKVPVLEGAGLGSALGRPPRFLELLGGATGPDPGISTLG